jgi:hypothetical protein
MDKLYIITLFSLLAGCHSMTKEKQISYQKPVIKITWENYDGFTKTDPKNAKYILDGKLFGSGENGFEQILKTIPEESTIVIYPYYPLRGYEEEPCGPNIVVPFDFEKLLKYSKDHPRITIILSLQATPEGIYDVLKNGEFLPVEINVDK